MAKQGLQIHRSADPHHFKVDPDPAFHFNADPDPSFQFNADPDPDLLKSAGNLRPLHPPGLHLSLQACIVSVHGPPRLYFKPLKLLNSDLNADSDPASKINLDPDTQPWGAWLPEFETALKGGAVLGAGLLQAGQRVLIPAQ